MTPDAVLIHKPAIDFNTFLSLTHSALGYSPARAIDGCRRNLTDSERFLSCLAATKDESAPAGLAPNLLSHVSFSILIAAEDRDLIGILEVAGMPFVHTPTIKSGTSLAVVTGTLGEWRDAVKNGCTPSVESNVRACFTKILALFRNEGLAVWNDCHHRTAPDRTIYLEDKR